MFCKAIVQIEICKPYKGIIGKEFLKSGSEFVGRILKKYRYIS